MEIVLASNNRGKLKELRALLNGTTIDCIPQSDRGVPEVAETGLSFVENAIIKARHASHFTGLPAIADDSGIEVDELNGAPGIYSARYAGERASDADNTAKLLLGLPLPRPTTDKPAFVARLCSCVMNWTPRL